MTVDKKTHNDKIIADLEDTKVTNISTNCLLNSWLQFTFDLFNTSNFNPIFCPLKSKIFILFLLPTYCV